MNAQAQTKEQIQSDLREESRRAIPALVAGVLEQMKTKMQQTPRVVRKGHSYSDGDDAPRFPSALAPAILHYPRGNSDFHETFSFVRAIRAMGSKNWDQAPVEKTALISANDTLGGYLVPAEQATFVAQRLTNRVAVRAAGARVVPMSSNVLNIPRLTAGATTYWGGETGITGSGLTESSTTSFGNLKLVAKTLYVWIPLSNDLLKDSTPSVEDVVREDIIREIAVAEDLAFIQGAGVGSTPSGFTQMVSTNINSSTYATFTYDKVIDGDVKVMNANAVVDGYITSPTVVGLLRKLKDSAGRYVWEPSPALGQPSTLSGVPVYVSKNSRLSATTHYMISGAFASEAVIGQREELDLFVDPYSKSGYNLTMLRVIRRVDFVLLHEAAFHVETITSA